MTTSQSDKANSRHNSQSQCTTDGANGQSEAPEHPNQDSAITATDLAGTPLLLPPTELAREHPCTYYNKEKSSEPAVQVRGKHLGFRELVLPSASISTDNFYENSLNHSQHMESDMSPSDAVHESTTYSRRGTE